MSAEVPHIVARESKEIFGPILWRDSHDKSAVVVGCWQR